MARSLLGARLMEPPPPDPNANSADSSEHSPLDLAALVRELDALRADVDALMSDVLLLLWDTQRADGRAEGPQDYGQAGLTDSDAPAA